MFDFRIDGFKGPTTTMWTPEHEAACCHFTTVNAINLLQKHLKKPLTRWAAVPVLFIQPRAGRQLNAYYDRQAVRLFFGLDPKLNKVVYTSNSTDVYCHELGHAILDAIRPDLFNMQAIEVWSFHEAFGDIHAVMNILQHDFALDSVLKATDGDLRKPSFISSVAEELGIAIFNSTGGRQGYLPNMLRNMLNQYTYVQPETLPVRGLDNQLTTNPHSFSRVFSGAWFDILIGIYETYKVGMAPKDALIKARDVIASYTYGALPIAPATIRFYDAMAKAMLVMDKGNNYEFNSLMNQKFIARGILRAPVRPMLSMDWTACKAMVDPKTDEILECGNVAVLKTKNTMIFNLPEHMFNVEVPADIYYEFNGTGECVDVITASNGELLDHAYFCVDFLKANGMIRPDAFTPFEITKDGNLQRTHFACGCGGNSGEGSTTGQPGGCCFDNGNNPNAPEFGKGYKIKNNSGCGCNKTTKNPCGDGDRRKFRIITANLVR
jgi:hypothetical protein